VKDFEQDAPYLAELVGAGAHLVGHSYGGIVALLAAALRPEAVLSLAVVEPPLFRIAAGHPEVDQLANEMMALFRSPPDPETFMRRFLQLSGVFVQLPPSPFPPPLLKCAQEMLTVRGPWEAIVPVEILATAPFLKLVVTGGHHQAYEVIADRLAEQMGAERAVIAGKQHSVQEVGAAFNDLLERFWSR
jgi:pimeloyl-ACP methyl ester carboxylesterase